MVLHICKPNTKCVRSYSVCAHEASVDYTWERVFNLNQYVYYFSKLRYRWILGVVYTEAFYLCILLIYLRLLPL